MKAKLDLLCFLSLQINGAKLFGKQLVSILYSVLFGKLQLTLTDVGYQEKETGKDKYQRAKEDDLAISQRTDAVDRCILLIYRPQNLKI